MKPEPDELFCSRLEELNLLEDFSNKVNYLYYLAKNAHISQEQAYATIGELCKNLEQQKKMVSIHQALKDRNQMS